MTNSLHAVPMGMGRSLRAERLELLGSLAMGVAHDFNNLLTIMTSIADALGREPSPPERAHLLVELDETIARAGLMTAQLLSLGRPQADDLVDVDLSQQTRALAPLLPRLLGADIQVDLQVAPGAVVRATRTGLEQVLLNLVVNARQAMPRGGRLELTVLCEEANVILRVKDSGLGMDEATRKQIFGPFLTTKAAGTGLGLSIV